MESYSAIICCLLLSIGTVTQVTGKGFYPKDIRSFSSYSSSCGTQFKFTEVDFKIQDGLGTRFQAEGRKIFDCSQSIANPTHCKCNVKNLVKNGDGVFENYDKACRCISACGNICAVRVWLKSDDADKPNANEPQPKLTRKMATCDCHGANHGFQCTCS